MWDQIWDKIFDNSCEIVLVLFLSYLLWRMTADIIGMINYYRADVYKGQVIKSLGTVKEATYISGHSPCYQTFEKYEVEYNYNGQMLRGTVLSNKKDLQAGQYLDVHALTRNSVPEIQTDKCGAKLRFFAIVMLISVAGATALVLFFA